MKEVPVDEVTQIFQSIRLSIFRTVAKIVPIGDVEDVVQETYVRMLLVDEPSKIENPKSYLFKIARNLALDSVKSAASRLTESWDDSMDGDAVGPSHDYDETFERAASSEEFGHFCEAVRQLPKQARRVFVLKKVYGYSQREIARELGIAESTVEKHISLAVRRCSIYMRKLDAVDSGRYPLEKLGRSNSE
jgi:RNA polymerase sigma factor (sigma-70 family)